MDNPNPKDPSRDPKGSELKSESRPKKDVVNAVQTPPSGIDSSLLRTPTDSELTTLFDAKPLPGPGDAATMFDATPILGPDSATT